MRTPRRSLLSLLVLALTIALAGSASADIRFRAVGNPTWKPTDAHLFTAPMGNPETGYAEFFASEAMLLPEPNHTEVPGLGLGPGVPHAGPYDREIARGLRAAGFRQSSGFDLDEFTGVNGVWTALMIVPRPGRARGVTPDSPNGPMIANDRFPLHVSGTAVHDGVEYPQLAPPFTVPPLDASIDPRLAGVEGHSHFPLFFADNWSFYPPGLDLTGLWVWHIDLTDAQGDGWRMTVRFIVRPG